MRKNRASRTAFFVELSFFPHKDLIRLHSTVAKQCSATETKDSHLLNAKFWRSHDEQRNVRVESPDLRSNGFNGIDCLKSNSQLWPFWKRRKLGRITSAGSIRGCKVDANKLGRESPHRGRNSYDGLRLLARRSDINRYLMNRCIKKIIAIEKRHPM
jgi:hypothetical protein